MIEVLVAVGILAFCLAGLLATYINLFFLSDLTRNITLATNAVQAKMEDIKRIPFVNLPAQNGFFNLTDYGFPGAFASGGMVLVQEDLFGYTGGLTRIKVAACFMSRGRLIGNDVNNCTASPVETEILIAP